MPSKRRWRSRRRSETANEALPEDRQVRFRIGVHVGRRDGEGRRPLRGGREHRGSSPGALRTRRCLSLRGGAPSCRGKLCPSGSRTSGPNRRRTSRRSEGLRHSVEKAVGLRGSINKAPVPSDRPSVAVLPFENLSGQPDDAYFSDGISDELITGLARFRTLFVIARNSSFSFRDRSIDLGEIGRRLGVTYLVQGSVRRGGHRIRITAQLVEAGQALNYGESGTTDRWTISSRFRMRSPRR